MILGSQHHSWSLCGSRHPAAVSLQATIRFQHARVSVTRDVTARARGERKPSAEKFKDVKLSSAGSNWDVADDDAELSSGMGWGDDFGMQQQYLQQRRQQVGANPASSEDANLSEPSESSWMQQLANADEGEEGPQQPVDARFDMFGLRSDEIVPVIELPDELVGKSKAEAEYIEWLVRRQFQFQREWHYEQVLDAAFESHHYQMENSVNTFATINRMASVMTQVELEDVMNPERDQSWLPSWARAEIVFREQFDEFNAYMAENIEKHVRKPLEMEKDDDYDAMNEVMMLSGGVEEEVEAVAPEEEQKKVLDSLLEGVLPGASLSSLARSYMDDIFVGAEEEEEVIGEAEALEE